MNVPDKIKCLVVDDEPLARAVLKEHISKIDFLEIVGECRNAIEANSFLLSNKVDLLFLDINMPHLSGLDFLKQLNPAPGVIFTTAYSEYALEGFELDIIDYLLKPINFQRFIKACNKSLRWLGKAAQIEENPKTGHENVKNAFMYLKSQDKMVKVILADIIAIESQGHYVKIYTTEKNLVIHQSITEMEERLPAEFFQRTHRSFIVGLKHIKAFSAAQIETAKITIPIGRNYKQATMEKLKVFK
jgi:two-component system LytT family response regulator